LFYVVVVSECSKSILSDMEKSIKKINVYREYARIILPYSPYTLMYCTKPITPYPSHTTVPLNCKCACMIAEGAGHKITKRKNGK
jgi:hypothetical protein